MAGAAAQSGAPIAGLRLLSLGALAALSAAPAHAGAWLAPTDGQSIWTEAVGERADGRFYESAYFTEAPRKNGNSAWTVNSWVQSGSAADGAGAEEPRYRAEATLAFKKQLTRTDKAAASAQVGAIWRSDPERGCGEGGAEARLMLGRNLGHDGHAFVNAELAERALSGGCLSTRFDVTLGVKPGPHWMAMAQVFSDEPRGGDMGVRAQLSLVRMGDETRGVQLGVRARLDGDDAEPMLVIGLWRKA